MILHTGPSALRCARAFEDNGGHALSARDQANRKPGTRTKQTAAKTKRRAATLHATRGAATLLRHAGPPRCGHHSEHRVATLRAAIQTQGSHAVRDTRGRYAVRDTQRNRHATAHPPPQPDQRLAPPHPTQKDTMTAPRTASPRPARFHHGMLALGGLGAIMLFCVVVLKTEPQIPLIAGCVLAGGIAATLGYTWDDILKGALDGIYDSLEAVLILMCIGMLVGVWIASGTVPTMIYYGLQVVTPQLFLPIAFLATLAVGIVLGSWGAAGTIGIAFIGIASALGIPLGMAAGAIVAGAYVSEIISPLVDGPNLAAAIADCGIFALCRRFIVPCLATCAACAVAYYLMGRGFAPDPSAGAAAAADQTSAITSALAANFRIGPADLVPLVVMIVCIALKMPAIPSFLLSTAVGMVLACTLQGQSATLVIAAANTGFVSATGFAPLDELLTNGGIQEMMSTISIVILVMTFSGIMKHAHLMDALIEPVVSRLHRTGSLSCAAVASGALFNVVLPDQYPAIAMASQMYGNEFRRRGIANDVWGNIVNSSAGITSVLVPWNTCAVYMVTILGVPCVEYLPYALFCFGYPLVIAVIAALFGTRVGWFPERG